MKLILPPLSISDTDDFSTGIDVLSREEFASDLSRIVSAESDGLVIGLDAKWGEGKTTFAKLWSNGLRAEGGKCVYFDAFENDYLSDAFYALTSLILELLKSEDDELRNEFKAKLSAIAQVLLKSGLKIGARILTGNVLEHAGEAIAEEIESATSNYIDGRFEASEKDKEIVEEFKRFLVSLPERLNSDKPVVIIIDELDRCRPDYAMEIIETIKHFLTVPKISWVLVMNREQLEQVVSYRYGLSAEITDTYLQKFIHLWALLPKSSEQNLNCVTYFNHCLERMGSSTKFVDDESLEIQMIKYYAPNLREIEQILTNYALLENFIHGESSSGYVYSWFSLYLSIVKVKFKHGFGELSDNTVTYEAMLSYTKIADIKKNNLLIANYPNAIVLGLQYCIGNPKQSELAQNAALGVRTSLAGGKGQLKKMVRVLASIQLR